MHPHSTPTKVCSKCKEHKPATLEHFVTSKTSPDGLYCYCKSCASAFNREYRMARKERIAARKRITRQASKQARADYARQWKAAHPQRIKELNKRWRDKNKANLAEHYRLWRAANRESLTEKKRLYYEKNKANILVQRHLYHVANKDKIIKRHRAWCIAHPERMNALVQKRRALKRNAEGTHSGADIQRQYEAQKGHCYYCHVKVGKGFHVDHVVPLSRGGSNGPENLVIACPSCNSSKKDRLPHEWPQGGRLL